jgi:hypothetical protein
MICNCLTRAPVDLALALFRTRLCRTPTYSLRVHRSPSPPSPASAVGPRRGPARQADTRRASTFARLRTLRCFGVAPADKSNLASLRALQPSGGRSDHTLCLHALSSFQRTEPRPLLRQRLPDCPADDDQFSRLQGNLLRLLPHSLDVNTKLHAVASWMAEVRGAEG